MWLTLMKEELGNDWLRPHLFRLGASSLLADIERQVRGDVPRLRDMLHHGYLGLQVCFIFTVQIYHHVTGQYAAFHELPMA